MTDAPTPAGIYIHFPFCQARCNYCSFVSFPFDTNAISAYAGSLESEISLWSSAYGDLSPHQTRLFDSIYIGGGTPSMVDASYWEPILDLLNRDFNIANDAEITIEGNPGSINRSKAKRWRSLGINRISLGAQSFHDTELAAMGRSHRSKDITSAFENLRQEGFHNISMDLLIGYPTQTLDSVRKSLESIFICRPDHVSVYLLEIKSGAFMENLFSSGELVPLDEDLSADMYELVCCEMMGQGYEQYEISNFSKPGFEAVHNMKYWIDGFYLGIGAGAHGRLDDVRYSNFQNMTKYADRLSRSEFPWESQVELNPRTRMVEALIMGLRLNRGVDLIGIGQRYSMDVRKFVSDRLEGLGEYGLFEFRGDILRLTDRGRLVSNTVLERLL